jgi:hypothetical protein
MYDWESFYITFRTLVRRIGYFMSVVKANGIEGTSKNFATSSRTSVIASFWLVEDLLAITCGNLLLRMNAGVEFG